MEPAVVEGEKDMPCLKDASPPLDFRVSSDESATSGHLSPHSSSRLASTPRKDSPSGISYAQLFGRKDSDKGGNRLSSAGSLGPPLPEPLQELEVRLSKVIDSHISALHTKLEFHNSSMATSVEALTHELRSEMMALVGSELCKERERSKAALADALVKVEAYQQRMVKWLFESALEAQLNEWIHEEVERVVDQRIVGVQALLQEGLQGVVDAALQRANVSSKPPGLEELKKQGQVLGSKMAGLSNLVYDLADQLESLKRRTASGYRPAPPAHSMGGYYDRYHQGDLPGPSSSFGSYHELYERPRPGHAPSHGPQDPAPGRERAPQPPPVAPCDRSRIYYPDYDHPEGGPITYHRPLEEAGDGSDPAPAAAAAGGEGPSSSGAGPSMGLSVSAVERASRERCCPVCLARFPAADDVQVHLLTQHAELLNA